MTISQVWLSIQWLDKIRTIIKEDTTRLFWYIPGEDSMDDLTTAIMADEDNRYYTERSIEPLYAAPKTARIIIVGQAP